MPSGMATHYRAWGILHFREAGRLSWVMPRVATLFGADLHHNYHHHYYCCLLLCSHIDR